MRYWVNDMTKYNLPSGKSITQPFNRIWFVLGTLIILLMMAWSFIRFNPNNINLSELWSIVEKLFTPKGNRTWADYFEYMFSLWPSLLSTLQMSFAGTFIGSVLAVPVAIFSSKNIVKKRWIYTPARIIMNFIRTIPLLVLALISVFFVGIGVLPGIIAITIFSFGIMSKMLYDIIETVDMSSFEALESTGASKTIAFRYSVIPQLLPVYISYMIYIFEINVRSSAILGYVGAGGIGSVIKDNILYNYDRVGAAIIYLFFAILIIQLLSNYVRGKLQ
jgi:phosphonate transport system permease protein